MSNSPTPVERVVDAFRAFVNENTENGPVALESQVKVFHEAAKGLLDREPDAFLTLELGGDLWTLIVTSGNVRLVGLTGEGAAEIRFLGPLRGTYCERIKLAGHGLQERLQFKDDRLPGGLVEIELVEPSPNEEWRQRRDVEIAKLRDLFRLWADAPATRESKSQ